MSSFQNAIARIDADLERRRADRRERAAVELLPTHTTFAREERGVFRQLERRRELRRAVDTRRAVAAIS
ncbi:MAG: hypothetical protein CSA65_09640 [Proteobacteria bacterium]|nr:MAG: hypothetical protein CSB49_01235 [Pseudomonadota bacterium]PIE17130.1 MAG: hypothetical protein CSA65_09640 [Pseudomonadota bacterium]